MTVTCKFPNCETKSSFNYINKKSRYCKKHKLPGMVNTNAKKCSYEGCSKTSSFNFLGLSRLYCKKHKSPNMINVVSKKCKYDGCIKQPTFNISGEKKVLYCKDHKLPDMIDIISKKCIFDGCNTSPSFNFPGETKKLYCKKHKSPNMIKAGSENCMYEGCYKKPYFNLPGQVKGIYCKHHTQPYMINIFSKNCTHYGCHRSPLYGSAHGTIQLYCYKHKLPGMINVKGSCNYTRNYVPGEAELSINCSGRALYGPVWKPKIHCTKHKNENDYKINNPRCEYEKCLNKPNYSVSNYPIRCEIHRLKLDSNITEKSCKNCGLLFYLNETALCNDCVNFIISQEHNSKIIDIKNFLDDKNVEYISYGIKDPNNVHEIDNETILIAVDYPRYKPDFVIYHKLFTIILEVDENQNKSYSNECENGRMIQLYRDFGGIPIIFIRFNPDNYINHLGELIGSNDMSFRKYKLINVLNNLKNYDKWIIPLSVMYLFYDGYNYPEIKPIKLER
jgi:hypothetical protein